jgi:hypothetical protein
MEPATKQPRSIDLTGLPEEAIRVVEHLVSQLRDQQQAAPSLSYEEWQKRFDAWMKEAQARAGRYPPGFVVEDSRETIYGDDRDE